MGTSLEMECLYEKEILHTSKYKVVSLYKKKKEKKACHGLG